LRDHDGQRSRRFAKSHSHNNYYYSVIIIIMIVGASRDSDVAAIGVLRLRRKAASAQDDKQKRGLTRR
jgi:hypothetical protein